MDQTPFAPPSQEASLFEMEIDTIGQSHLNSISRWGKFISITLLIIVAITILVLATQYTVMIDGIGELMTIEKQAVGILLAILIAFLSFIVLLLFFLLRACVFIRQGLNAQNSDRIAEGFKALRVVFTMGIVFSSLSILAALFTIVSS